jgi:septal ring factor EnvC (AmiA/AmiB activator)
MPRGRKFEPKPIGEQITALETKIIEAQNNLDTMKSKLEGLKIEKDKEDLETLLNAIRTSGRTVSEVLSMIEKSA